jgi:predicted dienelactone hydrolase
MTRCRTRLGIAASLTLALAAGACSSGESDAADTTTTTLTLEEAASAYTEPGPHPVGVTTLELDGGAQVEVWYPAVEGTTGTDTYDVRAFVPPVVEDLLTAEVPATYTLDAGRDADVADGTFPLVLYSHGFSSYRQASSFLTAHLASWGMIVAAPDHWSRDLYHVLGSALGGDQVEANDPLDDLRMTRDLLAAENDDPGSLFAGRVDVSKLAAVGHSAGGGTVLELARADHIAGYASLASGARLGDGGATSTTARLDLPDEPSLFVAGAVDAVVPAEEITRPAFDATPPPSWYWLVEGAGHNAFDDVCTFGNGSGLIGVAVANGLGGFLDAQPMFRRLGEDGCAEPAVPVEDTFPIIQHAVTAFVRSVTGLDEQPIGLGPDVANEYAVPVVIDEKS